MGLPGVKVGPLDPDASEGFGRVGGTDATASARQLIRLHQALHPAEMTRAFTRPRDDSRSAALDHEEIRRALGDHLPEGCEYAGAAVRGERDREQVLTFQYVAPSGRPRKGFVPYTAEAFPESVARGDRAVLVERARREELPWDQAGLDIEANRRENAQLRARIEALQRELAQAAAAGGGGASASASADESPEGLPEPVEGYEKLRADEIVERVKAEEFDDAQLRAILDYESRGANRKTVVSALEQQLGPDDPALAGASDAP